MSYSYFSVNAEMVLDGEIPFESDMARNFTLPTRKGIVLNYLEGKTEWHDAIYPAFVACFGALTDGLQNLFAELRQTMKLEEANQLLIDFANSRDFQELDYYLAQRIWEALKLIAGEHQGEFDMALVKRKLYSLATLVDIHQSSGRDGLAQLLSGGSAQLGFREVARGSGWLGEINRGPLDFLAFVQRTVSVKYPLPEEVPDWYVTVTWLKEFAALSQRSLSRGHLEFLDGEIRELYIIVSEGQAMLRIDLQVNPNGVWASASWSSPTAESWELLRIEELIALEACFQCNPLPDEVQGLIRV